MGSLVKMRMALDEAPSRLAFDRYELASAASSARTYDADGRLHVAVSRISKSNVCPYYGREIPNSEALGLDPNKIYRLWRDPAELRKSLPTWNNIPLLDRHLPTSAEEPQKESVVGSTGTDAAFEEPYLTNSLVVWDADAIILIERDEKRQLSCGYRYVADMTPGTINGEEYDGVMRNIVGNHVALVEEGRAGADVLVGDSKPLTKERPMIKTSTSLRSRTALMAQGALVAYLAPRLAADASIDLGPLLKGVNARNFTKARPTILRELVLATDGKLAADADLDEAAELLEQIDRTKSAEDEIDDKVDTSTAKDEEEDDKKAEDEEEDDDDASAEDEEEDKKAEDGEYGKKAEDGEKEEMVHKSAMDAAIARAKRDAKREVLAELQAMDEAREAVRPFVGEVRGKVSSPSEIYRMALDAAIKSGVDLDLGGVPTSAYPALVRMLPKPGSQPRAQETLAADSAAAKGFAERFPAAAAVRTI